VDNWYSAFWAWFTQEKARLFRLEIISAVLFSPSPSTDPLSVTGSGANIGAGVGPGADAGADIGSGSGLASPSLC
jgi:hypothetical protein